MIAALHAAVAAAAPGAVVRMRGDETGNIIVRVPMTIDGGGHILSVTSGTALDIEAPQVTIRNLTIAGGGQDRSGRAPAMLVHGRGVVIDNVRFVRNRFAFATENASDVLVRRVVVRSTDPSGDPIRIFRSTNVRIESSDVSGGRDVFVSWSPLLTVSKTRFSHLRYGLHDMFSPNLTLDRDTFVDCEIGTNFMYAQGLRIYDSRFVNNRGAAGYGIGLEDTDDAKIRKNLFAGNHVGINMVDSPSSVGATLDVSDNLFASNGSGLAVQSNARGITVQRNSFVDNIEQVAVSGGPSASGITWSAPDGGNYWSDYGGYARDGSPFGAHAYRPSSTFESIADANPDLQIFRGSVAASAIDFATRSLVAQPPPKLVDAHPFIRPPDETFAAGAPEVQTADAAAPVGAGSSGMAFAIALASIALTAYRKRRVDAARDRSRSAAVEVRSLTKLFKNGRGVREVSLRVEWGESVALWGPNGAGKTTLLRSLLGQSRDRGAILIDGRERRTSDASLARLVGYAPQYLPDFDMPVASFVRSLSALRDAEPDAVRVLFQRLGLNMNDDRSIAQLSGGLRQRLSVACSLIGDPPIVILDEPTAGLDRASRGDVIALLGECKAAGKTLIFTSHLDSDVSALADRIVTIEEGRIAE